MARTKTEQRLASRETAQRMIAERKLLKEQAAANVDGTTALADEKIKSTARTPSKRAVSSRKKEAAATKTKDTQKPKRATRTSCVTKDDDSTASASSKGSMSSIRKIIKKVIQPLKNKAKSKVTSEEVEQPVRRSPRKSMAAPVPVITSQPAATRRSRKTDAVETVAVSCPSNVNTAKKSNCARKPVPKEELQTVVFSAQELHEEPLSPTDSLSTTISLNDMSFDGIAASVAEFAVEEISIVKFQERTVEQYIPDLVEEAMQSSIDKSQEGKILVEDENSFNELVLVPTEDSVHTDMEKEDIIEVEEADTETTVTSTVPAFVAIALITVTLVAVVALVAYLYEGGWDLFHSMAATVADYFEQVSVQMSGSNDGLINESAEYAMKNIQDVDNFVQDADRFVETVSKELVTGSNTNWGRDL